MVPDKAFNLMIGDEMQTSNNAESLLTASKYGDGARMIAFQDTRQMGPTYLQTSKTTTLSHSGQVALDIHGA